MTSWDRHAVIVEIADDGPGFPPQVLARLGEPYLSGRDLSGRSGGDGEHMGLGIFIAQTLLQRTGAAIDFGNAANGGAVIRVSWPRPALNMPDGRAAPALTLEESTI